MEFIKYYRVFQLIKNIDEESGYEKEELLPINITERSEKACLLMVRNYPNVNGFIILPVYYKE